MCVDRHPATCDNCDTAAFGVRSADVDISYKTAWPLLIGKRCPAMFRATSCTMRMTAVRAKLTSVLFRVHVLHLRSLICGLTLERIAMQKEECPRRRHQFDEFAWHPSGCMEERRCHLHPEPLLYVDDQQRESDRPNDESLAIPYRLFRT